MLAARRRNLKEANKRRRKPYRKELKDSCEQCGFVAVDKCQLDIDHVDGNHKNNEITNLKTLCANCHRLKTKENGDWGRWYQSPVKTIS